MWSLNLSSRKTSEMSSKICITSNSLYIKENILYFEDHKASPKGIYSLDIQEGTIAMIYNRVQYPGRGFSMDLDQNQLVVHRYNPAESDILMIDNITTK